MVFRWGERMTVPKTNIEILNAVTKITIKNGDPTIYEFSIHGKILKLTSEELLSSKTFRIRWLDNFHSLVSFSNMEWSYLVASLLSKVELIDIVERGDVLSPTKNIVDDLIHEINEAVVVKNLKDALDNGKVYYNGNGEIYVANKFIQRVMQRSHEKASIRALREELDDYISNNVIPLKVGKHSYRFWRFRLEKLCIDVNNPLEFEEEIEDGKDNKDIRSVGNRQN